MTAASPLSTPLKGLSIHLLNPTKGDHFQTQEKVERFIRKIVKQYELDHAADHPNKTAKSFEVLPLTKWKVEEHQHFHAQIYFSKVPITSNFTRFICDLSSKTTEELGAVAVSYVFFLYRNVLKQEQTKQKVEEQWELFALTTNDGGHLVKRYASKQFPMDVALRVIDPRLSAAEKKPIAGQTDSSNETYRSEFSLLQNEMETVWKWFKGFHSHFKKGSSIYNPDYKLLDFSRGRSKTKEPPAISVSIGAKKILIPKSMTISEYEKMLIHFSLIYRGEATFCKKGDQNIQEESDLGIKNLTNIQPVEEEKHDLLNEAILKLVWNCFDSKHPPGGLSFAHRHYRDFYQSGLFILKWGKQEIEWYHPPSIADILETLRKLFGSIIDYNLFLEKVKNTRFKFDKKSQFFPLADFFNGELRFKEEVYFRIDGVWLKVRSDQLIVLQRDFYQLLQASLKPIDGFDLPWIARKEWAGFSLAEMAEQTEQSEKEVEKHINKVKKQKFSFLNKKGEVICPYPTRCLLEGKESYVKTLKKRWVQFEQLFAACTKQKKAITKKDLETLLESKKGDAKKSAESLLASLTQERPVLVSLDSGRAKKVALLNPKGIPIFPDMNAFQFTVAAKTHQVAINTLLKKKYQAKEPLGEDDLKKILTKIGEKKKKLTSLQVTTLFNRFVTPQVPQSDCLLGTSRSLVQGPIDSAESDIDSEDSDIGSEDSNKEKIGSFLSARYTDYRMVLEEEGYNRLYLNKPGFIVGDQVYADQAEKVELFDVLHYADNQTISLIHVKEGFGQKTREACAQIRVSATCISNAIRQGKGEILENFYQQVVSVKDGASPFRIQLKKQMEKSFPTRREFVQVFQQKKVCFVYAFIDDAAQERFLSEESSPSYRFKQQDLLPLVKNQSKDAAQLVKTLKEKGMLDAEGRLTAKFLRTKKETFLKEVEGSESVYSLLNSKTSRFDSLVAKIELLELKNFLVNLGFELKICQIPRSSLQQAGRNFDWPELPEEDWEKAPTASIWSFVRKEKTYQVLPKKMDHQAMLGHLLRVDREQVPLKLYQLLIKNTGKSFVKQYLKEKKSLDVLSQSEFGKKEMGLIAKLLDLKIYIFPTEAGSKKTVDVEKPEIIHKEGKKSLFFVEDKENYHLCEPLSERESDTESEEESPPLSLSEILTKEDQIALLASEVNRGLVNSGKNVCFFNAMAQLILHSPLLSGIFNDKLHLDTSVKQDRKKILEFFTFWKEFILSYHLSPETDDAISPLKYDFAKMRQIFGYAPGTQQDAPEILTEMSAFYKSDTLKLFQRRVTTEVDLTQKTAAKPPFIDASQVDDEGKRFKEEFELYLYLYLSDSEENNFETLLSSSLKSVEQPSVELKFTYQEQKYSVHDFIQTTEFICLADEVFLQINRFEYDKETGRRDKKTASIGITSDRCEIHDQSYELKGFVVHQGETLDGGHYLAYCKTEEGWFEFDDEKVIKLKKADALKKANDAYILHFKKREE